MECLDHEKELFKQWLASLDPKTDSDNANQRKKSVVRCKACDAYLTENTFLIPIHGETNHFFTNPSGMGFDLLTYEQAEGCVVSGTPTEYFTWFEGFYWQYSYCKQCGMHLGWYYSCEGLEGFFGLITDCLKLE